MATVNFLYRSTKPQSTLNVRLLFRHHKDFVLGAKTQLSVSRKYWDTTHKKNIKDIKDVEQRNLYNSINMELSKIEDYVLSAFDDTDIENINKAWLKSVIDKYYNPKINDPLADIPRDFIGYVDFYINYKKSELTPKAIRRINVTKHKMQRLQQALGKIIFIKDINEDFKKEFQDYSSLERYSQNTQQRELVMIKTICYHAKYLGLETHHQLGGLKLKRQSVNHVFLTFDEIDNIKNLDLPFEYLDNARDWLLISCYTGQRVSDFMRFNKGMIRLEEGKHLLEFKQQKTGKLMTIPISKDAREVLKKRNGDFPRVISDQKYNDYIKEVCKLAGLNERKEGKKRINITPNEDKATYRDVLGEFEKWELISSHVGRRSFATNYYGKVPTSYLINITGHGSETMFLNYIKKSNKDMAMDAYAYFN